MGKAALGEKSPSNYSFSTRLKRAAAAALLALPGPAMVACQKETKPVVPIEFCSKEPLRITQPDNIAPIDIRRQSDGSVAPPIPELVQVAMAGAMVEIEYGSGKDKNLGTGAVVEIDGTQFIISAAHLLNKGGDATHVPNLNELFAIDADGNKTGMVWARQQFQLEGGAPVTPVEDPRRSVDVDVLIAKPAKPIGSGVLKLASPERGAWEALGGYIPGQEDPRFVPGLRMYTGTTLYNASGAVLTGLAGPESFVAKRNSGGPMVKYQKPAFGVTGVISGYNSQAPTPALLKQSFNITLPEGSPPGQLTYTTPSTVVLDMLKVCGPGVASTSTP